MNKNLIILLVVVLILGVGGFLFLNSKKASSPSSTNPSGNVITSIKDALSKSVSLQCNFTDEGGRKTTSYIKNGAVRADIESQKPEESGSVIVKDNKVYFWNKTEGFMMDISKTENKGNTQNGGASSVESEKQQVMDNLEKYKDSCKPAIVSDSLFVQPSNIKFTDFTEMLKGGSKAIPSIDQSQYQKYLQQISQPPQEGQ